MWKRKYICRKWSSIDYLRGGGAFLLHLRNTLTRSSLIRPALDLICLRARAPMVAADKAHSEKRREYSRTPVLRFCTSRVSVPGWKGALRAVRVHVPSQRSGKGRKKTYSP